MTTETMSYFDYEAPMTKKQHNQQSETATVYTICHACNKKTNKFEYSKDRGRYECFDCIAKGIYE